REEVAAGVKSLGADLFGRHVSNGADGAARAGEMLRVNALSGHSLNSGSRAVILGVNFGQAEVQNFGVAAFGNENVGGLDIAMDDALRVCSVESIGDFDANLEEHFEIERSAHDDVLEGLAV